MSNYRTMNQKLATLRTVYPQTLLLRRAVECRVNARLLRKEAHLMSWNLQGKTDRERLAEMMDEKVETLTKLYREQK